MRFITSLLFLVSLTSSITLAVPIDTSALDAEIAKIDTGDELYIDCDKSNPQCKALNGVGTHSVTEIEQHLGKQAGVIAKAGSKVAADEGLTDLSNTLKNNGPVIQHDLHGRATEHSELNKALKEIAHDSYPAGTVKSQGAAIQDLTQGVADFGKEAHRQFDVSSTGCQYHCDEVVDAIIP